MENNHAYTQAAEEDDLDDDLDDFRSTDSWVAPNYNLDAQYIQSPPAYQPLPSLCIVRHLLLQHITLLMSPQVCNKRPPYAKGGKRYPTCGLTCAAELTSREASQEPSRGASHGESSQSLCVVRLLLLVYWMPASDTWSEQICETVPSYSNGLKSYPTCGLTCATEFKKRCNVRVLR